MQRPKRWVIWVLRFVLMAVSAGGLWFTSQQAAAVVEIFLRPPPTYPPPDDATLRETILEAAVSAAANDDFDARILAAIDNDDMVLAEVYFDLAELLGPTGGSIKYGARFWLSCFLLVDVVEKLPAAEAEEFADFSGGLIRVLV